MSGEEVGTMPRKIKNILAGIAEARDSFIKLERLLSGGPATFYFEKIEEYIEGLFRLGKFKIGDAVQLVSDFDCSDSPGWRGCEHFLKRDAVAVISDVCFGKRGFSYGVVFDNETYVGQDKVPQPVSKKHEFWFLESTLKPRVEGEGVA